MIEEQKVESQRSPEGRFSTVAGYVKNYRGYLVTGAVAVILSNGLILIQPLIIKKVFDLLELSSPASEFAPWIILMFGLALAAGAIAYATRRTIIWMSHRMEYDLRRDLWSHLLGLSAPFFRRTRTGDIMARLTNDIEAVRLMVGPGILHSLETAVTFLIAIPMMLYLSPMLTVYSLAPVLIFPFAVNKLGNMIHRQYGDIQRQYSDLTSAAQENLRGIRVVRAYQLEVSQLNRFKALSEKYVKLNLKLARMYGFLFPLTMFMASCLSLSAFYFGGMRVMHGELPLGTLVAFFVYLGILFWPMFALGGLVSLYQRGSASLDRINEFLFARPDVISRPSGCKKKITGKIEFRHLRFRYSDSYVLNDINLVIEPGQKIGIVGRTGSGKSTLVSLIARLYPVPDGQLFIDETDVNDWEMDSLRSQIGYATQEAFLFSDSIRANIEMGATRTDRAKLSRSIETAGLGQDIGLFPAGLDTVVGERGILLSGGQKQRTSIARALIGHPRILILDDVTSAVDAETEAKIRGKIGEAMKGNTTMVVSHRLTSVMDADQIVLLEGGRIKEHGTHDDLMRSDGEYAAMFRAQQLVEELEQS